MGNAPSDTSRATFCGTDDAACCGCEPGQAPMLLSKTPGGEPLRLGLSFMPEPGSGDFGDLCRLIRNNATAELDERLYQDDSVLDDRDTEGNSLLHYCVKWRSVEAARVLCAHGIDPDAVNVTGKSAAGVAACIPDAALVRDLVAMRKKYRSHYWKRRKAAASKSLPVIPDFQDQVLAGRAQSSDAESQLRHSNGRLASSDYSMMHNVVPSVNEKEWASLFKSIETRHRSEFDQQSQNRYNPKSTMQTRVSGIGLETRTHALQSWARLQKEHLDEERQKKLESDNCMMVRNSLARASVPYTVRHAPWGGYCKIKPDDEDDQRAGTMLMSRAADDAVRKLTLVKPLIE
eukprot:Tamp_17122.p1 GENE.Tamp_17122~~Tamp_17122.p1  ORF type:complete len:347 (+),score=50.56 Tamp_17122:30-1070(+)